MILSRLSPATGPLLVAAALLATAGVAKLRRPAATGLALARAGLPGRDLVVRTLGAVEVAVAALAVLLGGATAAGVALLYAGFAAFTAVQVRRARATGEVADCGCFGHRGTPVDGSHVAINVLLAAGAAWAVAVPTDGLEALVDRPGPAAALAVLAAVGAVGIRALLTDLAVVRALVHLGRPT